MTETKLRRIESTTRSPESERSTQRYHELQGKRQGRRQRVRPWPLPRHLVLRAVGKASGQGTGLAEFIEENKSKLKLKE